MYFKPGSWFWREAEEGFGVCLLPDKAVLHRSRVVLGTAALPRRTSPQPTGCRPTSRPALRLVLLGSARPGAPLPARWVLGASQSCQRGDGQIWEEKMVVGSECSPAAVQDPVAFHHPHGLLPGKFRN